jgi:hypothetical protein
MLKDAMITVRIPAPVKEALHRAAEADLRSLASLTAKVLTDYVRAGGFLTAKQPPSVPRTRKER